MTDTVTTASSKVAAQMAAAATAWIASLSDEQRLIAVYTRPGVPGADEDERLRWFFTPTDHGGLTLHGQSARQQSLVMQIVSSALSLEGYVTAATIMGSENILDRYEKFTVDWGRERGRDPLEYYLRIFGEPSATGTWAWRFGGHHISLNNLVVDGSIVSMTPHFFGMDPAETEFLGGQVLRPLGASEDRGRELFESFNADQKTSAWLLDRAPADIVMGNRTFIADGDTMPDMGAVWRGRFTEPRLRDYIDMINEREEGFSGYDADDYKVLCLTVEPKGVAATSMTADQRDILRALLQTFFGRVPTEIAATTTEFYANNANLDEVHFAWAGGYARGERHYFRVQGPRVLIEYDNTQRGGNHCHAVWRDPVADFGLDVLYEHLDVFHGPAAS
jgi:hypothetical protein